VYLSLDESLVNGDKIVWPSSFLTCHDGGCACHSAVLRGDYYDWWLEQVGQITWSITRVDRCRQSASLCSREVGDVLSAWSETLLE